MNPGRYRIATVEGKPSSPVVWRHRPAPPRVPAKYYDAGPVRLAKGARRLLHDQNGSHFAFSLNFI